MEQNEGEALCAIREDDAFFSTLIDQIPAKHYFDQDTVKELREKIKETTESVFGGNRHQTVGQTGKHKFAKFNPHINKSVLQILGEIHEEERGIAGKKSRKMSKDKKQILQKQGTLHSAALDKASSIEALQRNLRDKIEKMKNGRNLEQIRAKREFEKLRQTQKNKKGTGNKVKNGRATVEEQNTDEAAASSTATADASKPGFQSDGKMVFSKFDFSSSEAGEHKAPINNRALKKLTNVKGLKGYKKQLEFVEDKQRKLAELKQTNPEKAAEIEEKSAWLDALDKARGIKKKDNAELLKKTIKKREKLKERSKKKWTARQETVKKQQDERQNKRKTNLQARRDTKVKNKMKKLAKKGRLINVPGF